MGSDQNGQDKQRGQSSDSQSQTGHDKHARDRAAASNVGHTTGGNFAFLRAEWPALYDEAIRAERLIHHDPRAACFYARRAIEITARWMYDTDSSLNEPYKKDLAAMLHEPTFKLLVEWRSTPR